MLDLTGNLQPKAAPSAHIRETDSARFENDVLAASMQKPVIVDFWAPWCGPCKQMMPHIEKVVTEAKGAVELVKVNVDASPELAEVFRVQSVPAVFAFFQGQPIDGFMGARSEKDLKAFVDKILKLAGVPANEDGAKPDPALIAKQLETAATFLRDEKYDDAMAAFSTVLDADPENAEAFAGIGWCFVAQKDLAALEEYLANLEPALLESPKLKGLAFLLARARDAAALEDAAALIARLEKNPKDHAARYDLALQRLGAADLAGAIDQLVELTRKDREWQEQKARKLLLELFDAMGPQHPLTAQGRRKLSTVLFS